MKLRGSIVATISLLLLASMGPGFAQDPTPSRADQVTAIQNQYNPLFDSQYARLLTLKKKALYDASALPIVNATLTDFLGVRRSINADLASATADLETVKAYAEEETGEFANTLYLLETQVAKNKTITCVKGKVVKKISAPSPKCAKGYKKK